MSFLSLDHTVHCESKSLLNTFSQLTGLASGSTKGRRFWSIGMVGSNPGRCSQSTGMVHQGEVLWVHWQGPPLGSYSATCCGLWLSLGESHAARRRDQKAPRIIIAHSAPHLWHVRIWAVRGFEASASRKHYFISQIWQHIIHYITSARSTRLWADSG